MLSLRQVLFHHPCFAIDLDIIILLNPSTIDEHGEWCLKVEPQDKQSQ